MALTERMRRSPARKTAQLLKSASIREICVHFHRRIEGEPCAGLRGCRQVHLTREARPGARVLRITDCGPDPRSAGHRPQGRRRFGAEPGGGRRRRLTTPRPGDFGTGRMETRSWRFRSRPLHFDAVERRKLDAPSPPPTHFLPCLAPFPRTPRFPTRASCRVRPWESLDMDEFAAVEQDVGKVREGTVAGLRGR
jgi:hypothetical protein